MKPVLFLTTVVAAPVEKSRRFSAPRVWYYCYICSSSQPLGIIAWQTLPIPRPPPFSRLTFTHDRPHLARLAARAKCSIAFDKRTANSPLRSPSSSPPLPPSAELVTLVLPLLWAVAEATIVETT